MKSTVIGWIGWTRDRTERERERGGGQDALTPSDGVALCMKDICANCREMVGDQWLIDR